MPRPHLPIDVQAIGTDFLACSAYKFFGPHVGVLYGRREVLDALPDLQAAPGVRPVRDRHRQLRGVSPGRWRRSSTSRRSGDGSGRRSRRRFPGMTGRRLEAHAGMAAIRAYEMPLFGRLLDGLEAIPGAKVWGITDRSRFAERTPTAAVTFRGHHAGGRRDGPRASAGSPPGGATSTRPGVIERLGLAPEGVLRIGLTHYNTTAEVDRLLAELRDIVERPPRRRCRPRAAAPPRRPQAYRASIR